ncbi:MAG: immunoglobulin domain-containing protein, partial [Bacteroidota bacterium]|nr:immunoglobulin domain-containing protein [Bacteroidota bacterium]
MLLFICSGSLMAQPWSFTITNSNHTIILLNDPGNYTINGQAIETGDYIGAFHVDSTGALACAGYFSWYDFSPINESMAVYGAYGIDNGFVPGEEFIWKIWQASTNTVFIAEATYNTALPDSGFFNENGLSLLSSLEASSQISTAPWSYTITNSNHLIILLNDANNYLIDNQPIQPGDFIGAFYEDSLGVLACAGYFEWFYFAPNNESMSAFGAFEIDNGFQPGEEFSWKFWRASDSTEMDAVAYYNQSLPDQEYFNPNGFSLLDSLITESVCDTPLISGHPVSQTKCEDESLSFYVTASGSSPLTYTWLKDGTNTGATGNLFTINNVTTDTAGNYTCIVSNACGSDTSNIAILTVNESPSVSISGTNSICEGDSSLLDAGTFDSYNWSSGESTQTINVSLAGEYSVTVSDINGCEDSDTLQLSV